MKHIILAIMITFSTISIANAFTFNADEVKIDEEEYNQLKTQKITQEDLDEFRATLCGEEGCPKVSKEEIKKELQDFFNEDSQPREKRKTILLENSY